MRIIADLHVHSRYSRATSPEMDVTGMERWARLKGIGVVGTGDFTHPRYLEHLKENLVEADEGLYRLKSDKASPLRFLCTVELSLIYKDGDKTRKIHHLVLAPDLEAAGRIGRRLAQKGNVASDGRPIFGFSSRQLVELVLESSPRAVVIPAHAWTPWFSVFGSKSGYDSLEECFGDMTGHIRSIETGLSSDRPMNRRCSMLDGVTLISNSDAHSPSKLGREANALECQPTFASIVSALQSPDPAKFPYTIEFFPEEGKYHWDGHRDCKVRMHPREAQEANNRCPVCFRPLTLGVMHRVEDLADRPWDHEEEGSFTRQKCIMPLETLLADAMDCGPATKKVQAEYLKLVQAGGGEFPVLLDLDEGQLAKICAPKVAQGILAMRQGKVRLAPGYDGVFGKISVFKKLEGDFETTSAAQMKLL